jgi:hypothetical protein
MPHQIVKATATFLFDRIGSAHVSIQIRSGFRNFSTTRNNDDDLTNRGVVEGVWIFSRHGDRAPSHCLSPSHKAEEEVEYWTTKLPRPNSYQVYQAFSSKFPPSIHVSNEGQFLDVKRFPFGFLSHQGILQTRENGKRLFERYRRIGHHFSGKPGLQDQRNFLKCWDVNVYSTNYLRTILSVQSLLDGILGTKCYDNILAEGIKENKGIIPDHSTAPSTNNGALINVKVRGRSEDTLNAFDRNPELIAGLVSEVISSESFQEIDGNAAPLAARLSIILPGLARKKKNTTTVFNKAPSRISWVEAADHFVCRTSHDIEYSRFSDFEHETQIEQTLEALSHQTKAHLAWRFREWYKSNRLLAAIAAPPLREIANQILPTISLHESERRPFSIYSCHDVTILALLYGIGADFLAGDDGAGYRSFWPGYSSTLVRNFSIFLVIFFR